MIESIVGVDVGAQLKVLEALRNPPCREVRGIYYNCEVEDPARCAAGLIGHTLLGTDDYARIPEAFRMLSNDSGLRLTVERWFEDPKRYYLGEGLSFAQVADRLEARFEREAR